MSRTIHLTDDAYEELAFLADTIGFPPDLAAIYAIRLVGACYREGLISDEPSGAWPPQARPESVLGGRGEAAPGDGGQSPRGGARVLAFPGARGATKNA